MGMTWVGNFRKEAEDRGLIELFGDLKRHDMGQELERFLAK